jgi:hypothetical protein
VLKIFSPNVLVHSERVLIQFVMVLVHVGIFQASRPAVLVWVVLVHHSHALMSQLMQTPTETVLETAMNAMALEPAEGIILFVLVLLLHAVVPVPGLLTVVKRVPIHLVPAGMQPAAAMYAVIHLMALERIAEVYASHAMGQVVALTQPAEAIIRQNVPAHSAHAPTRIAMVLEHADTFLVSRLVVLVWVVPVHHSHALMSQQMRIPMGIVLVTVMNAMALEPAEETTHAVPGLLPHVAVLVLEIPIIARLVLILLALAEMQPAIVMFAGILLTASERIAEHFVSPAMVRVVA